MTTKTEIEQRAERLYYHAVPALMGLAASMPAAQRETHVVLVGDLIDPMAFAVMSDFLPKHARQEMSPDRVMYTVGRVAALRAWLSGRNVGLVGKLSEPLDPGNVRIVLFVRDGYHATQFAPGSAQAGLA